MVIWFMKILFCIYFLQQLDKLSVLYGLWRFDCVFTFYNNWTSFQCYMVYEDLIVYLLFTTSGQAFTCYMSVVYNIWQINILEITNMIN